MSRAIGRSYADFFPTAPSVLQEKKKLARSRPKLVSDSLDNQESQPSASQHLSTQPQQERQDFPEQNSLDSAIRRADRFSPNRDGGDLLNGVGSASSLASTTSSIFSATEQAAISINNGIAPRPSELTPMTNDGSSPREQTPTPRSQHGIHSKQTNGFTHATSPRTHTSVAGPMTPLQIPCHSTIQVRPAPGLPKGCKAMYDPELDASLPVKDRKKVKVKYVDFSDEVCACQFARKSWN